MFRTYVISWIRVEKFFGVFFFFFKSAYLFPKMLCYVTKLKYVLDKFDKKSLYVSMLLLCFKVMSNIAKSFQIGYLSSIILKSALYGPALCVFALCGQIFIGQSPHFAGANPALCGINSTFCCVSKPIILKIHIFAPFLSDFKVHFFKNLWQYKQQVFCVLISWKYTQIFFDFYSKCHDFNKNFLPPITTYI